MPIQQGHTAARWRALSVCRVGHSCASPGGAAGIHDAAPAATLSDLGQAAEQASTTCIPQLAAGSPSFWQRACWSFQEPAQAGAVRACSAVLAGRSCWLLQGCGAWHCSTGRSSRLAHYTAALLLQAGQLPPLLLSQQTRSRQAATARSSSTCSPVSCLASHASAARGGRRRRGACTPHHTHARTQGARTRASRGLSPPPRPSPVLGMSTTSMKPTG